MTTMHDNTSDPSGWSTTDQTSSAHYGGLGRGIHDCDGPASPVDSKNGVFPNIGILNAFQKPTNKVTRDGQPAKRRGPKPDSKPAQTRRQELNRQAQRTHRERKEQYIKALEIEIARLREAFIREGEAVQAQVRQQDLVIRDQQQENVALRDMLLSRGISFENELATRKANIARSPASSKSFSPNYSHPTAHSPYRATMTAPSSALSYASAPDNLYGNGGGSLAGRSPGTTYHSNSPDMGEQMIKQEHSPISDMPGIFEKDPQLGVDFILQLEATCRDHGEYLVRRSLNSPDDPDQAKISGHALMASVPPPSHIERTPALKGGLEPTWPHQAPTASIEQLRTLLNLSERVNWDEYVDGGQVTPIMALQSLRGHQLYQTLTRDDVVGMMDSIRNKVRCYGFGAVMEDFELRDALSTIFATKPETYENFGNSMTAEIEEMYS